MDFKNRIFAATFLTLMPALTIYSRLDDRSNPAKFYLSPKPSDYVWQQVLPFGNGSMYLDWMPGTYPMGLQPLVAFDGKLWITGQKQSWSSADGKNWEVYPKKDWGERISISRVFFKNKLWMYGGMQYQDRRLLNEVWFSEDGINWQQAENAAWASRKGHDVVEFKNKLWLFGGATKVSKDFETLELQNDIWSSDDGMHWTKEVDHAPWSPRDSPNVLVLRGALYLMGGQGLGDVWRSVDGKNWTQVTAEAAWKLKSDKGALVYDNMLWVFGGRDTLSDHHRAAQNDVWFSLDGAKWIQQAEHAPWTVRSGTNSVVFKDKLWLYSGKHTGGNPVWKGDIWVLGKKQI